MASCDSQRLSAPQQKFFDVFGFLVLRGYLTDLEVRLLSAELNVAMGDFDRTAPQKQSRILLSDETPSAVSLAEDPRFARLADELLDRPTLCIQVAGYLFVGPTPWHPDNHELGYSGIKFCVYLDRVTADSGALRVLPGSHRNPLWRESGLVSDTRCAFGTDPEDMPAYAVETEPGDVIAFRHELWHASFHGADFRRMIELNYYADPVGDQEEIAFRRQMRRIHSLASSQNRQFYPEAWLRAETEPRCRWIARLDDLGVLYTAGAPRPFCSAEEESG